MEHLHRVRAAISVVLCVVAGWSLSSYAEDEPPVIEVEAQPLAAALNSFSEQTGIQFAYVSIVADGIESPGTSGKAYPTQALDLMLAETGLTYNFINDTTIVVVAAGSSNEAHQGGDSDSKNLSPTPVLMAQNQTSPPQAPANQQNPPNDDEPGTPLVMEEIIVTGTNIRGIDDQFSPVISVSRNEIDFQGMTTVEDLMSTIPQNFGGGGVSSDVGGGDNANGAGASAINLRGLGVEATLVLLNGRRVASGGGLGNFVDVSAIPVAAIDRVEIVADGASAVYGSDAVSGVVNIILRSDYQGAETQLNYDIVTDGGASTVRIGQTFGFSGSRANGLVTYQYSDTDPLESTDKDFSEDSPQPNDLTPSTKINSIFASVGLNVNEKIRLSADLYSNGRKTEQFSASQLLEPTASFTKVISDQRGATGSIELDWSNGWNAELIGTFSESELENDSTRFDIALTTNQPSEYKTYSIDSIVHSELPSFSQKPSRLAFGGHFRAEEINSSRIATDDSSTIISRESVRDREVLAVYGELYTPIIAQSDSIPAIASLAIIGAIRYDEYDDVGSSTNPRVGVIWSPIDDLSIRGTWGTSFRAPALFQLNNNYQAILSRYQDPDTTEMNTPALLVAGNTDELDPEESESWSAGFDWTPSAIDGFQIRATYFSIDYDGRIGVPGIATNAQFRLDNFTGTPVRNPSPQEVQSLIDGAFLFFNFADILPSFAPLSPDNVEVIIDVRNQNLEKSRIRGLDISANYSVPLDAGTLSMFFNGTFIDKFEQQVAPKLPIDDRLDTFGQPNGMRYRAGVQWTAPSLAAGLFVNHTGDYEDSRTSEQFTIDSWTTVDASVELKLDDSDDFSMLRNSRLSISVRNILNEDPPTIADIQFSGTLFDAAKSDPFGRRFGITFTKHW